MARVLSSPAAYRRKVRMFEMGTESAGAIEAFLLDRLTPVSGADRLFLHSVGNLHGQLRVAADRNNRLGFAFHIKGSADQAKRVCFRRDRTRFPHAPRDSFMFFTPTVLWAQLNGLPVTALPPDQYRGWN